MRLSGPARLFRAVALLQAISAVAAPSRTADSLADASALTPATRRPAAAAGPDHYTSPPAIYLRRTEGCVARTDSACGSRTQSLEPIAGSADAPFGQIDDPETRAAVSAWAPGAFLVLLTANAKGLAGALNAALRFGEFEAQANARLDARANSFGTSIHAPQPRVRYRVLTLTTSRAECEMLVAVGRAVRPVSLAGTPLPPPLPPPSAKVGLPPAATARGAANASSA
ncbi:hypothetical protein T492DRAFT_1146982, partial [Pavlovales sp. CCMP2436]